MTGTPQDEERPVPASESRETAVAVGSSPRRAPIPPSSRAAPPLALAVLRPLRSYALLMILTMLLARALLPALRGVVVGISDWVERGDIAVGILSQLLAFGSAVLLGAMLVQLSQTDASRMLRYPLVVFGVLVVLATSGSAAVDHPPAVLLVTLAVAASSAAVLAGADALRRPTGGYVGLVWIFAGVASLLRLGSAELLELAIARVHEPQIALRALSISGHLATASFAVALVAQLVAMAFVARRGRWALSPQVVVAIGVGFFVARWLSTPPSEHSPSWLVLRGVMEQLTPRPWPAVPSALLWAQAAIAPVLALATLTVRREVPALLAALSLVLLVPGTADVPMLGLCLFLSSVSLALVVRDSKGVWASLEERSRQG